MRYTIFLFLLFGANYLFAQNDVNHSNPFENPFPGSKWYLNAAQISYFGLDERTTIITSDPSDHYIFFGEKLEFGSDSTRFYKRESSFFEYRFTTLSGNSRWIELYASKRDKKKRIIYNSYDLYISPHELVMVSNETLKDFEGLGFTRTLFFSKQKDSLELITKILGSWETTTPMNLLYIHPSDTVILSKTPPTVKPGLSYSFLFSLVDGAWECSSACFDLSLPEGSGYPPDPYYVSHNKETTYEYAIDLSKQQLIINNHFVFDILELNNEKMKLVMHQE